MAIRLTPDILLHAYAAGIFPMAESAADPELFWVDPTRRGILPLDAFHVPRSLRKTLRKGIFEIRCDTAFAEVMEGCAEPRADEAGTWITDEMLAAYVRLAELGFAHSVEVWAGDGLVGGLYGVAIGRMFYGESMFSRATDASKVALVKLVEFLKKRGFAVIDCQMHTPLLESLGAREIPRAEFLRALVSLVNYPETPMKWNTTTQRTA